MASDGYGDRAIMVVMMVMMVRWLIPRGFVCLCGEGSTVAVGGIELK